MEDKLLLKSKIEKYLRIPFLLGVLLIAMNLTLYTLDFTSGLVASGFVIVYVIAAIVGYITNQATVMQEMISFAFEHGTIQKELLRELIIPYTLVDAEARILWSNQAFYKMIHSDRRHMRKHMHTIIPDITKELFPDSEKDDFRQINIAYDGHYFRVEIKRVNLQNSLTKELASGEVLQEILFAIYFYDETELIKYITESEKQKLVSGLIYIDNYEEVMDDVEEVRQSLLIALIDRRIHKYMQSVDAIIKKLEKDKYLFVCQQQYLEQLQVNKFSLLDEVRSISIGNEIAVTLSIAVGADADTYLLAYEYSHMAMDLALGRGGDQAVVKKGEKIFYYGGKTQSAEKSTRVKARVKAHALKELFITNDKVMIMGHKLSDIDSLGAALGIYRLTALMEKKAHIVINEISSSIRPIMNTFLNSSQYPSDLFLSSEQAIEAIDYNTVLVVVDVNRSSYTECEELLTRTKSIVVIDHHRQGGDVIEHATLSYIEPYASSACEMVAEILQYLVDKPKLRPIEADAMYSGILVDTDNFVTKTGVRTFEAASFLRKSGADMTRVRKMFRSNIESHKKISEGVNNAEIYLDYFAISVMPNDTDSPTVLAAKVANDLLDIDGVRASFVLTELKNQIYISARSLDDVNVQVIMEHLDGGGHATVAGAQLPDVNLEEARQKLKDLLHTMYEEGDL